MEQGKYYYKIFNMSVQVQLIALTKHFPVQ